MPSLVPSFVNTEKPTIDIKISTERPSVHMAINTDNPTAIPISCPSISSSSNLSNEPSFVSSLVPSFVNTEKPTIDIKINTESPTVHVAINTDKPTAIPISYPSISSSSFLLNEQSFMPSLVPSFVNTEKPTIDIKISTERPSVDMKINTESPTVHMAINTDKPTAIPISYPS